MARGYQERLEAAVRELDHDDELGTELAGVRKKPAAPAAREIGLQLESMSEASAAGSERISLETIVLRTGRPVLNVVNDDARLVFADVESKVWKNRLVAARPKLGPAIRAVGRIEVQHHALDWLGTGWLVAPDVIVTNRHVAREFALRRGDGFVFRQGFGGLMSARIDFLEELGRSDARELALSEVLHIEDDPGPDVAFLRVKPGAGVKLASPIALLEEDPVPQQRVAVIGYPARDSRIPEQDLMLKIFGDVFDKKRLAPGEVKGVEDGLVLHDCSTLGGNSGSVVLDLATGKALALHFSGRFLEANFAVSARDIARLLRGIGRPRPRPAPARPPPGEVQVVVPGGDDGSVSFTVPLHIRVEVGEPEPDGGGQQPRPPAPGGTGDAGPAPDTSPEEFFEGRVEDYSGRRGYLPRFLGFELQLPDLLDRDDVLRFKVARKELTELRYEHFSVVMSKARRMCRLSAANVNGATSRRSVRSGWRLDPRIGRDEQIKDECYGNSPKFARGHMTRREDPAWGPAKEAERGNVDSMHVTNVVPQMQPFNAGIWLGLEDYALQHARKDDMKISVLTGPVFLPDDPTRYGVRIPRSFWKVIAFIHDRTKKPCVTAYTLNQEGYLKEEEFVFGQHETAQVPLAVVETSARIKFPDKIRKLDPLDKVTEARPLPLRDFTEIRFS